MNLSPDFGEQQGAAGGVEEHLHRCVRGTRR
jgi:hypothetical protein